MKRIFTLCMAMCTLLTGFAQTDTTSQKTDTIKIGGMIIIRKPGYHDGENRRDRHILISNNRSHKPSNVSTNWFIFDLGFANYNDKTDYTSVAAQQFSPGSTDDRFKLRTVKSINVNIWLFMQKLNLVQHAVNLKYGLGLELNNYRYEQTDLRFHKNPVLIDIDPTLTATHVKKNKLAADYITVPLMLNFNFTPGHGRGFGLSAGISAGYLYSARQKTKIGSHVNKLHDDFDLERWKLSYIGELNLGPVRLYGSYAMKSMWSKGLDQTPYTVGLRFSNW